MCCILATNPQHPITTEHFSSQPDIRNGIEDHILIDVPWADMAVVIDDGQLFCHIMIELLRGFRGQQEVFSHKLCHSFSPFR